MSSSPSLKERGHGLAARLLRNSLRTFTALSIVAVSAPQLAQTQTTGRIAGAVRDPAGAVLVGAEVRVVSDASGDVRKVTTDDAGNYAVALLAPGRYKVRITISGFKDELLENVAVALTETTVINADLSVGAATGESVTVSATVPLVQAGGPQLGRVVDSRAVSELPLATRNFTQILGLSTGAITYLPDSTALGRNTQTISVNGARVTQNSFQLNGVDATTMGTAGSILVAVPAPETVHEFKVQTSLYDAAFGRAGGGNIQMVTRSGSNSLRGAVYQYFRNEALNANNPFLKAAYVRRPVLKRQVFGGTLGGPLRKDRTFFFLSYQGTRERNGASPLNSVSSGVLIAPGLTADRSETALRTAFQVASIHPVALALLNARLPNGQFLIPTPPADGRYYGSAVSGFQEDQFNTNVDHRRAKDWTSVRFFFADGPSSAALPAIRNAGANVPGFGFDQEQNNRVIAVQDVHVFGPTAFNDARIGYAFNRNYAWPLEPVRDADIGIRRANAARFPGLPLIRIAPAADGIVIGTPSGSGSFSTVFTGTLADTVSITRGSHSIRTGAEFRFNGVNFHVYNSTRGQIDFLSFQDFLAGAVNFSIFGSGITDHNTRAADHNFFVQDDWKMSPTLTLNLGLRYELDLPAYDTRGLLATFDQTLYQPRPLLVNGVPAGPPISGLVMAGNALPQYRLPEVPMVGRSLLWRTDKKNLAPRIGLAWSPLVSGRLAVRAGGGLFHSRPTFNYSSTTANVQPSYVQGRRTAPPLADPFFAAPPIEQFPALVAGVNLTGSFFDRGLHTPVIYQYNASVQLKVLKDLLLEIAYVGTRGINLFRQVAINQARLATPQDPITNQVTGTVITTNTPQNAALRAPFQGVDIAGFTQNQSTAQSTYHSLQASLTRRFSKGMQFLASYTFGKSIDNGSGAGGGAGTSGVVNPQSPTDTGAILGNQLDNRANRGISDFDRTHRLVFSYLWDLPRPALATRSRSGRLLLSGWQISGILTAMSGLPIDVVDQLAGSFYGLNNGFARPNFAPVAHRAAATSNVPDGFFFNPYAFARPVVRAGQPIPSSSGAASADAPGTDIGFVGRNILRGPRQVNVDFGLARRFRMTESKGIEFRAEFFNLLNHVNLANPMSDFNGIQSSGGSVDPNTGQVLSPGAFGRIVSTSSNPRIIQLALKFSF
jgi:hypothetical protein